MHSLTKNLSAEGDCLVVTASRVDIDLQGHTIRGNGTGAGVRDTQPQFAITVRNGTIANFDVGVDLGNTKGAVVVQLRVVEIGGIGIDLLSGRVRSNVVFLSGSTGIRVFPSAGVVSDNFVSQVGGDGIFVAASSVVGNSVSEVGVDGVLAGCPSRVTDNSVVSFDQNKTDRLTGLAIRAGGIGCSVSSNASF